jgi:hypothetical protein
MTLLFTDLTPFLAFLTGSSNIFVISRLLLYLLLAFEYKFGVEDLLNDYVSMLP